MTDRGAVCATRCGCGQYRCLACVSLVLSCIVPVLIAVTTLLHFVILAALAPHKLRVRDLPPDNPFFGLSADNLNDATAYTWVQLSDTHIKERNSTNTLVFERFCNEIISVLKPTFADFTRLPATPKTARTVQKQRGVAQVCCAHGRHRGQQEELPRIRTAPGEQHTH